MRLPFLHRRLSELDARVQNAQQRATQAAQEAETSRKRREAVEKNIVEPLHNAGAHNQFAELIRQSLILNGNHKSPQERGRGNA